MTGKPPPIWLWQPSLAVAVRMWNGNQSAARAMALDFIPVGSEEYDFAIPEKYLELPHIRCFIEILNSEIFKNKVKELGGYDTIQTGKIIRYNDMNGG